MWVADSPTSNIALKGPSGGRGTAPAETLLELPPKLPDPPPDAIGHPESRSGGTPHCEKRRPDWRASRSPRR